MAEENGKSPLGLPRGSVRAILAIAVVIAVCYSFLSTGAAPEGLMSVGMLILGFYFGQKIQGG